MQIWNYKLESCESNLEIYNFKIKDERNENNFKLQIQN